MKKVFLITVTLLSGIIYSFIFTSCDKIKSPKQNSVVVSTDSLQNPVIHTNDSVSTKKKVLIEDYTGHFCGFCPRAARTAENLVLVYGSKIVIVACHVSPTFAAPQSDTLYKEDFRCDAGSEWDTNFGMSNKGLPEGTINRLEGGTPKADAGWSTIVANALAQPAVAYMNMRTAYDAGKRLLDVKVKTTFIQAVPGKVLLTIIMTQDSLVTDQKDYVPPAGVTVIDGDIRPNYVFNHRLVGSLNGTWGQLVKDAPAALDTVSVSTRVHIPVNLDNHTFSQNNIVPINDNQLYIVAFLSREDTKEVLQVEKLKLR